MTKMLLDVERYRVQPGDFSLNLLDTDETQGWAKGEARAYLKGLKKEIARYQERLYAEDKQSVLLIFQAMDAAGKDSTISELMSGINPQGCRVSSFKSPSKEELAHDYLWRIHAETPQSGMIRIFNRSHYEDVLIVRVHGWVPVDMIGCRYRHINEFERALHDNGTRIVKVMLHISPEYQLARFKRRLELPDKWWKFNPDDLEERKYWKDYMEAFEIALNRCSSEYAPWYVVPAERKWFRTMVVAKILRDLLAKMDPQYPKPSWDPGEWTPERLKG